MNERMNDSRRSDEEKPGDVSPRHRKKCVCGRWLEGENGEGIWIDLTRFDVVS